MFLKFYFFRVLCFFLLELYRKRKIYECDGLGNPIPYKMMFVSATQPGKKNVWEDAFLVAKVLFFREGKNTS